MYFERDKEKRQQNIHKHGLDFVEAIEMFDYPMLVNQDTRFEYGEERFVGIGLLKNGVGVVIFLERKIDVIRIISLRKALKHERKIYESRIKN